MEAGFDKYASILYIVLIYNLQSNSLKILWESNFKEIGLNIKMVDSNFYRGFGNYMCYNYISRD